MTQYHFTSWPDHGVPEYAGPMLNYLRRIKAQHKPNKGPILVHCRYAVVDKLSKYTLFIDCVFNLITVLWETFSFTTFGKIALTIIVYW